MNIFDLLKQYQEEQAQAQNAQRTQASSENERRRMQEIAHTKQKQEAFNESQKPQVRQGPSFSPGSGETAFLPVDPNSLSAQLSSIYQSTHPSVGGGGKGFTMADIEALDNQERKASKATMDQTSSIGGGIRGGFDTSMLQPQRPRFSYGDYERQKREREMDEMKNLTQKKAQRALQGIFDTGSNSYLARLLSKLGM